MASLPEQIDLAPDAPSVRAARAFVGGVLRRWGLARAEETATLLTSELATNVVRHARTRYAIVVTRTPVGVQVDVLDHGNRTPEQPRPDLQADSGRGLLLVSDLAASWGPTPQAELRGFTKGVRFCVTAEVAATSATAAAGTSSPATGAAAAGG